MAKRSRRYRQHKQEVKDLGPLPLEEALKKLKSFNTTKFDQSVEVAIRLGIDPKRADQMVRGSFTLPHSTGKQVRVAVFAQGERAKAARKAGADIVGGEDLAERIRKGQIDFDVCLASVDMMRIVGPLGRILGPKGLMPSPKSGTVVDMNTDIGQMVKEYKAGKVEYRADSTGNIHAMVGKLSLPIEHLKENIEAFINHIKSVKPAAVRGQYIRSVSVSATMSPGIRVIAA